MTTIQDIKLSDWGQGRGRVPPVRRGFTLVEMVVAMAIIVVLVTLVLPAANALWSQRKTSEANNTIQSLLMTARARALRAGRPENGQFTFYLEPPPTGVPRRASGGETGLLFFVDKTGVQRIVSIAQVNAGDLGWENVFGVTPDRDINLPEPMRVVPRYVVDNPAAGGADPQTFSPQELAKNDFDDPAGDVPQRHRNFFTMIYSDEGHLLTWRDVLIYDEDGDLDHRGDRTGLWVGDVSEDDYEVDQYYDYHNGSKKGLDVRDPGRTIPYLVTSGFGPPSGSAVAALNLPSVDGLLVYDDSLFNELETAERKREFLLESAEPFYVNRLTGAVIRGPRGENVAP